MASVHDENHAKTKGGVFSDEFGLRCPVIQKTFFSDEKWYLYHY